MATERGGEGERERGREGERERGRGKFLCKSHTCGFALKQPSLKLNNPCMGEIEKTAISNLEYRKQNFFLRY
jgi:hypothetical protein